MHRKVIVVDLKFRNLESSVMRKSLLAVKLLLYLQLAVSKFGAPWAEGLGTLLPWQLAVGYTQCVLSAL